MKIEITIPDRVMDPVTHRLDHIIHELQQLQRLVRRQSKRDLKLEEDIMAEMQRLRDNVAKNTDAVAAASTLLTSLAEDLRNSAGDTAAVNALADQLDANNAALADAVARNTPAEPPGPPPEVVPPPEEPPVEEPPA